MLKKFLLCSIADYFYELCRILTSPWGWSNYKRRVKILSDTQQKVLLEIYYSTREIVLSVWANFAVIYLRGMREKYAKCNGIGQQENKRNLSNWSVIYVLLLAVICILRSAVG